MGLGYAGRVPADPEGAPGRKPALHATGTGIRAVSWNLMAALRHLILADPMALVWPLVIFTGVFAGGWLARRLLLKALDAWAKRAGGRPGRILTDSLRGPLLIWALILAVHLALEGSELPARYTHWTAGILFVLWALSLIILCMRVARDVIRHYGGRIPGALPVTTLTQNLAQAGIFLLGAAGVLYHFGISITPMITALGVGGLAVALGLQDTLANLFAGFYVAVAGQIRLGDYIKLSTGEEGYVSDIGWRVTTVRALANNLIIIPNAKLAQAIVTNYHLPEKRMAASLQVGVSYDCDPEHIEQVLVEVVTQAAGEIPELLADPAPSVMFDPGFGDSSLNFTVNYQVPEFVNQYRVRHLLRKRIFRRFQEEGIEMPFPTRTVYMKSASEARGSTDSSGKSPSGA